VGEDKPLPLLLSDNDAEAFVGPAELAGYDLPALTLTIFQYSRSVHGRLCVCLVVCAMRCM
jgi:hypothetical protein